MEVLKTCESFSSTAAFNCEETIAYSLLASTQARL
jgi:hypothetical protein